MKHITILTLLLCCSCTTKKVVTNTQTTDTVHTEHQERRADTLNTVSHSETKVLNISAVEIISETIVYDTEHTDSTGKAPIKEKRKTTTKLQSSTTIEDTTSTEAQHTSSVSISEQNDSTSNNESHITEKRISRWSPPYIVGLIAMVGASVYIFRMLRG